MALFENHFYHEMTKRYTVAMGSLFSDINVVRYKEDGSEDHRLVVPLSYSPKEKFVQRLTQDADHSRKPAITLPRMAFELASLNYDGQRKLQKLRKYRYGGGDKTNPAPQAGSVYTPVPYELVWNLYIVTKTQDEMLQIIEQILPAFTPDVTLSLKGIANPETIFDVPISLLDVEPTDTFEGMFEERRQIMWSLSFLMKAVYFGPITTKSIILQTDTPIYGWEKLFPDD